MKLSYQWLNSLLPEQVSLEELSTILTSIGLEVDSIESSSKIPGGLQGLVIGKVLTCEQHSNADKLRVTTVDVGNNTVLPIVCGAPNVAAGQTVVVATVGTTIHPTEGEPFEIKKAKIRGEVSEGMICAEDEIGLGQSHDGIIVITDTVEPGTSAAAFYNIPEADYTIEIGLTPNRMDAMSHMGVAKDVCAYLSNKNNKPYTQIVPATNYTTNTATGSIAIDIQNNKHCKRYLGVELSNIKVAPSPEWLRERLATIGVRSINNVVDITNYVLHETGQPLHAFDKAAIEGNKVIVRSAAQDELFTCLDGTEKKLQTNDLLIANANNGMCIAGVFGGEKSGVNDATTSIFLESAWFAPDAIRKTSMHHGLRTEAAIRFEKGVDVSQSRYALERAVSLLCEICNAKVDSAVTDIYPTPLATNTVSVSYEYINRLSGANYSKEKIRNILLHLCFAITKESDEHLELIVPYAKPDISLPADIVEEIMRIDGLDNVPFTGKISFGLGQNASNNNQRKALEKVATCLNNLGFNELFTNSISNSAFYPNETKLVRMLNSLSAELDCMRPSMVESGLQVISYNLNRKNSDLLLFEVGKIYFEVNGKYIEQPQLHMYLSGKQQGEHWRNTDAAIDVYTCKTALEALANRVGLNFTYSYNEDGSIAIKQKKQTIGGISAIGADKLKQFDIKQAVWHIYLDWKAIVDAVGTGAVKFTPVSKHQSVRRDLALVVDASTAYDAINNCITSANSSLLSSTNVFDVFESDKLGAGKKSIAVSFTFAHPDRTLTDAEIDSEMQKIRSNLEKAVGASVRS
ncbi:MAG: hypothetical protein RL660_624 [Bacteroidota bacterium]|jgi:phenylalanyl-tRNA synthetase beta chain